MHMKQIPVGYQLYSAREDAQKDLAKVCRDVKALGYDGVEFAGFFGRSAGEIRAMLEDCGLKAVSSHVPVQQMMEDPFGVIAFHRAVGFPYMAIPALDAVHRPGAAGFAEMLRFIGWFGGLCREAGIRLLYHNHDFEFVDVSGVSGLDFIYQALDPAVLQTEIDVCWVKYAGVDPAAYLRKYAGRAPVVHLKDYVGVRGGGSPYALLGQDAPAADNVPFAFRPFGHGCQDAAAVVEAGADAGAEWFVVEQDAWNDLTPMENAKMSLDTLVRLGVKKG